MYEKRRIIRLLKNLILVTLNNNIIFKEPTGYCCKSNINKLIGINTTLQGLCLWGKNNQYCDAPAEISKWPTSSDGAWESSEGLLTHVTPSLRPPKPPRTGKRQFSWRNSPKGEICLCMRIFKPLEFRKEKELTFKKPRVNNKQAKYSKRLKN